jgi:branched-chain amino acid aminotransferase
MRCPALGSGRDAHSACSSRPPLRSGGVLFHAPNGKLGMHYLLNNAFVPDAEARIPVSDRGFLYGDAAFDTLCAYGGRLFRASQHLQRLSHSLAALRIELPRTLAQIEGDLYRVLERNDVRDAILRITVSRGSGARGPGIRGVGSPTYLIACYPGVAADPAKSSVKLEQVAVRRVPAESLPAQAKTANYLNSILALAEAMDAGADEALLLDMRGCVAECAYSNVFFVSGKALLTPALDAGILPGITRAAVLELARGQGVEVREVSIEPDIALAADEAFITNTVRGVVPVHAVGAQMYPARGPLTAQIARWYWDLVEREAGARWPQ